MEDAVNVVEKSVVFDGDCEENNCVEEELVCIVFVFEDDIDESDCMVDFEDEEGSYVDVFGRIVGDSGLPELVDGCLKVDDCDEYGDVNSSVAEVGLESQVDDFSDEGF